MRSLLSYASLGIAAMLVLLLRWSTVDAQPTTATTAPISAKQQAAARKVTNDAIEAERAKHYTTAITLYKQAYQLVPHPILQFNIGQVYMIVGNRSEAERYFRHYLARDPNGPGAPIAREFLTSLRSAASPPQTGSPAQPASSTSAEQQTSTMTSGVASAPEHKRLSAGTMRDTDKGPGMRTLKQSDVATSAADLNEDELRKSSGEGPIDVTELRENHLDEDEFRKPSGVPYAKEKHKHATETLYIGYALMGAGAVLGVTALAAASDSGDRMGLGIVALVVTGSGFGTFLHARHQIRAANSVAWSPVVGAGFAGVALAGSLP